MARRMKLRLVLSVVAVALASSALAAVPANAACVAAPARISLGGMHVADQPRPFFLGDEGSPTPVTIRFSGGCGATMFVDYATSPGSAQSSDYGHTANTASATVPGDDTAEVVRPVPITGGDSPDAAVESVQFSLSNPRAVGGSGGNPTLFNSSFPILIVDEQGGTRVSFEGVPYSQSETFPSARIPVFSAGASPPSGPVTYTIDPGPGNPATPGEDYTATSPGTVNFGGQRWATIPIGVINDEIGEGPEDVTITLSGPDVSSPNSTTFTIEDNEESERPKSRFHHPRHKWRYKKSDYRIREFHVFASDNPGGAGVVGAQMALKRTRANGACQWFTGKGWQAKDCQNREWLDMKYDPVGQLFLYRMKQLKSSVGTRIKNYTAFSRAIDGSGNVESDFKQKRNDNTFEIKRTGRRR
jgi:Calx-beta domain